MAVCFRSQPTGTDSEFSTHAVHWRFPLPALVAYSSRLSNRVIPNGLASIGIRAYGVVGRIEIQRLTRSNPGAD